MHMSRLHPILTTLITTLDSNSDPRQIQSYADTISSFSDSPSNDHHQKQDDHKVIITLLSHICELVTIPSSLPLPTDDDTPPPPPEQLYFSQLLPLLSLSSALLKHLRDCQELVPSHLSNRLFMSFSRLTSISPDPFLSLLIQYQPSLPHQILKEELPRYFSKRLHPKLDPATGRKAARVRGGDKGMVDWFNESGFEEGDQEGWRESRGLANVVKTVVSLLQKSDLEVLWPYVLPPILSFLDDYSVPHKLSGLSILNSLLAILSPPISKTPHSDGEILRRTGVGEIFVQSLHSNFTTISSPLTPILLPSTLDTAVLLLPLLYLPHTLAYFNSQTQLFTLFLIQPLSFAGGQIDLESALMKPLPSFLEFLGPRITTRFLAFLIPHYSAVVSYPPPAEKNFDLIIGAIKVLECCWEVLRVEKGRRKRWSATFVAALARCWFELEGAELGEEKKEMLRKALKGLLNRVRDCREVDEVDWTKKLTRMDVGFQGLAASPLVS